MAHCIFVLREVVFKENLFIVICAHFRDQNGTFISFPPSFPFLSFTLSICLSEILLVGSFVLLPQHGLVLCLAQDLSFHSLCTCVLSPQLPSL